MIPIGMFFTVITLGVSYSKMNWGRSWIEEVILFPLYLPAMRSTFGLRQDPSNKSSILLIKFLVATKLHFLIKFSIYTRPNSEIICGQNVGTKVVCGMILFFEKKAMLKIWKKSCEVGSKKNATYCRALYWNHQTSWNHKVEFSFGYTKIQSLPSKFLPLEIKQ